jgi:protein SCO1/2
VAGGVMLARHLPKQDVQVNMGESLQDTIKTEPLALTAFTLTDQNNRPFGLGRLKGKWTFMFFGYTRCPDVCPTTLAVMQNIATVLERDPRQIKSQFVFVSIDPQRDSLSGLGGFVEYFNPGFIGLSGNPAQLQGLVQQIGVEAKRLKGDNAGNYLMSHTSAIMLIDPQARLQAKFPPPHERAGILKLFYSSRYHYQLKQEIYER